MLDAGGAAAVVAAMHALPDDEKLQTGGAAALANMAWGDSGLRAAVITAGAQVEWLGEEEVLAHEAEADAAAAAAGGGGGREEEEQQERDDDDDDDDDLELDEEDMDDELLEAIREVLEPSEAGDDGDALLAQRLDQAATLRNGSKEMAAALRGVWRELSLEQKKRVVADSDDEGES